LSIIKQYAVAKSCENVARLRVFLLLSLWNPSFYQIMHLYLTVWYNL